MLFNKQRRKHTTFCKMSYNSTMIRLDKIGEGSYGIVYSGRFKDSPESLFAVKRNFKELSADWIGNVHEADILVRLKGHSCIVELYRIAIGDPFDSSNPMTPKITATDKKDMKEDKIHFILEYVSQSGESYLQSHNFSYLNSRLILCQVALALKYMHSKGIIHRDLKPANILISYDEAGSPAAKVCDFGMSCNYIKSVPSTPGVVTCWYRAPEICFAHESYDEKADVWSFGCLLFEFISKKPWLCGTADNDEKIVNAIIAKLEELPSESDIDYLRDNANKKIKVKTNDYIKKRLIFESQLELRGTDKFEFERSVGPLEVYIDLLKKCLEVNPKKRISIDEILKHKFFEPYIGYIDNVNSTQIKSVNESIQFVITDTAERRWAFNEIFGVVNDSHKYIWYKDLVIFHALDLFDRYMEWVQSEKNYHSNGERRIPLAENETKDCGKIHNQLNTELRIWVCMYIMHKYYATLEHPKKWSSFAPSKFNTKEYRKQGKNFEMLVVKNICNYRIFRETLMEMIDKNQDDTAEMYIILRNYAVIPNYIGSIEGLYRCAKDLK